MSMADPNDELAGTEAAVRLPPDRTARPADPRADRRRHRLRRAVPVARPRGLYDLLAQPLVAHLPKGTKLIATNVISPILVPLKITLMAAFLVALPIVLYQVWAFVAPGCIRTRRSWCCRWWSPAPLLFVIGVAFCYFFVIPVMSKFIQAFAPKSHHGGA
jgi:Sec-independent protein secretion pathway component TatC